MKQLYEYLLSKKHNKVDAYPSPKDLFKELCNGNKNETNFNIDSIIEGLEQFLESEHLKEHMKYIMNVLDKAIEKGYTLDYSNSLSGFKTLHDGTIEGYFKDDKLIRFSRPNTNIVVINFLDLERLMLYAIEAYDNDKFEVYIYKSENFDQMVNSISKQGIRWKLDYDIRVTPSVEKLEESVNKSLGL